MIYAAFLRGMNLGNRRITNDDLRAEFERIGLDSPQTFQAAGNVVFESSNESESALTKLIESELEAGLGYPVPTVLRSRPELEELVVAEPFPAEDVKGSKGKLQVMLLAAKPTAAARKRVLGHATDQDRLAFGARELFWLPSGGMSDSDLDLRAIEKALPTATTRTRGTIERLAAKFLD
ncbi:MAG: DUF1697 domain-containing protein [Solirubrobacterales bacterium]|nr:DUF1697 domain-containing protein [Solirubrobacterales bacterium]